MTMNAGALAAKSSTPITRQWLSWLLVVTLIYLLLAAVGAIGDGFKAAVGDNAKELFAFATNPFVGLMIGLAATALIQSSSTVTSIIVGMTASAISAVEKSFTEPSLRPRCMTPSTSQR
jgi:sodium-dependent phosphate cotransporter